jgi:site-specific recombinase XerC
MTQTFTQPTILNALTEYIEQFVRSLSGANKSRLTIQAYSTDIQLFATYLSETDYTVTGVRQITRGHIDDYFAHLHEKGQTGMPYRLLCSDAVWRKGLLSIATYLGKSRSVARATSDKIK